MKRNRAFLLLVLLTVTLSARPAKRVPASSTGARRSLKSLTLREKVGQLFVLPFYGESPNSRSEEYRRFVRWVRQLRIGGLVLVNQRKQGLLRHAEPYETAAFLNRVQRLSRIPLLVAGDFERGASMRIETDTKFPQNMAFTATRDPALSRFEGAETAREARALGVQWLFAPVADVNNNADNPIINIRSYGENPEDVSAHVRAFVEGAQSDPKVRVLTTAKHFPGHGDTAVDTHMGLATLTVDRARLDRVELVPFRAAIEQGVDAIMTAHIATGALDPAGLPSTLSRSILAGLLREDLGFKGIIVTDALDMAGITAHWKPGDAAVRAFEAGADVLLMPADPEEAISAVVKAVETRRISMKRLDDSVARILAAKTRLGLFRNRLVNLENVGDELNSPEAVAKVREIAERSVTLVRNQGDAVPVRTDRTNCFLILAEGRYNQQGRTFQEQVRQRMPGAKVILLDPQLPDAEIDVATSEALKCDNVVAVAFVSVAAYRGNVALAGQYPKLLNAIQASGKPLTLVAMGNPYLLRAFPNVSAYLATYSTVAPSETAAVRALFGEIPITGKLPVTIPNLAAYGDGIQLPAVKH